MSQYIDCDNNILCRCLNAPLVWPHGLKNDECYMRRALVSPHGFNNDVYFMMCSALVCPHGWEIMSIAPFTLPKILGTVRIKMVRVPENVALIRRLHTLFSAGPSIAKFVLVRVPGSSFWPADIHGTPAHMRHFLLNMAPYWVELLRILSANLCRPKAPKARQKMWDRLGQSFTLDILSEPGSFFWYKYPFYPCSDYLFSRSEHG